MPALYNSLVIFLPLIAGELAPLGRSSYLWRNLREMKLGSLAFNYGISSVYWMVLSNFGYTAGDYIDRKNQIIVLVRPAPFERLGYYVY